MEAGEETDASANNAEPIAVQTDEPAPAAEEASAPAEEAAAPVVEEVAESAEAPIEAAPEEAAPAASEEAPVEAVPEEAAAVQQDVPAAEETPEAAAAEEAPVQEEAAVEQAAAEAAPTADEAPEPVAENPAPAEEPAPEQSASVEEAAPATEEPAAAEEAPADEEPAAAAEEETASPEEVGSKSPAPVADEGSGDQAPPVAVEEAELIVPAPSAAPSPVPTADAAPMPSGGNPDADQGIPPPPAVATPEAAGSVMEESRVASAAATDTTEIKAEDKSTQPLNLKWTFGLNSQLPVLNLNDGTRNMIAYAASHNTIIYDYKNCSQILLEGHTNAISCITCSTDKRWLVTGDKGPNCSLIVWDSYTGIPVQTAFDVCDSGLIAVAMSSDAKHIVTLSDGPTQTVSVWDWTSSDEPIHTVEVNPHYNNQTFVAFHPENNHFFVTNSPHQVLFYSWESGILVYDVPQLSDSVFNRTVGLFSASLFQQSPSRLALTATSVGNIVVWAETKTIENRVKGKVVSYKHRPLKLVRVSNKSLTTLRQVGSFIVSGDHAGHIRFYDDQLNLTFWLQNLKLGPVREISFDYAPFAGIDIEGKEFPPDATISAQPFAIPNFVVSTKKADVIHLNTNGCVVTSIFNECNSAIKALAASPTGSIIVVGSENGLLKTWDYDKKTPVASRIFDQTICSVAFSHDGLQIAVGLGSGSVHILDSIDLSDDVSFKYTSEPITHAMFAHNSAYLATADAGCTVSVFKFEHSSSQWKYLGRYRSHYDSILDLKFGFDADTGAPRLLSLGKDRVLVEYDLQSSTKDNLVLASVDRIEQSAVPLCFAWYPPVTKESFIMLCNDQYKMKLYNTTTKLCRKTFLGPTYGSPVKMAKIIPVAGDNADTSANRMMCYATERQVGVQLLPLDGNPHRSVCVMAFPDTVTQLVCSNDGKYIFASGGEDCSVHMWEIDNESLEAIAGLGGEDLIPFYGLLDGGRDGPLFAEIEDYFYFCQLRSQGIDTTEERVVSTTIDLEQVPFMMRALGFYPSEQEVEDIVNEVKFSEYVETGEFVSKIDLGDFIKLYINHRPAFGLSLDTVNSAFNTLSNNGDGEAIDRNSLLKLLESKGEHLTSDELVECMNILYGKAGMDFEEISEHLPGSISQSYFVNELLGLNTF